MQLRRSLVYLMTLSLIILSLPSTHEAASFNHVDRVLTVMQGEVLGAGDAPVLKMTLLDELEEHALFYIDLTGGSWIDEAFDGGEQLEIKRLSETRLQVKVVGGNLKGGTRLQIPMQLKVTGPKAVVHIRSNNTVVSSGDYLVAEAASYKGEVIAKAVPKTVDRGIMAEVTIQEPFSRAFSKATEQQGCDRIVQLQLDHNDYAFGLNDSDAKLIGSQGFEGIESEGNAIRQVDAQTLEITLPDTSSAKYTGCFTLQGVLIKPSEKQADKGVLSVNVRGDLVENTRLEVLEVTDYAITLSAEEKTVRGGTTQHIQFTLEEMVQDSLVRNRPTRFVFSEGIYLSELEDDKVKVTVNDQIMQGETILDDAGRVIGFEIARLPGMDDKYTFHVQADIAMDYAGTITLTAEGRSLLETLTVPVAKVYQPFEVKVSPMHTVVGVKDQLGGEIIISEAFPAEFIQGECIVLEIEACAIRYGRLPKVEVISGDLRLGSPRLNGRRIEIPVVRRSNKASTVRLSQFNVTVDQTVALGGYNMQIGGKALTMLADESNLIPVWHAPFVWVEERRNDTEQFEPSHRSETVCFTIGSNNYVVGQLVKGMEAPPYISNGRTMLPVKYVADAIGIAPEEIVWHEGKKQVTIYGEDTIVLQVGNQFMTINGEQVPMSAAPQIVSGRTFIPVAEITRALKIETQWNSMKKQVSFVINQKI